MNLELRFGALVPSLAEQLDCRPKEVELWQRDVDAITRLLVRGLITESAGRSARKKMLQRIAHWKQTQERRPR